MTKGRSAEADLVPVGFRMPEDLHIAAKVFAAENKTSFQEVMTRALRDFLVEEGGLRKASLRQQK